MPDVYQAADRFRAQLLRTERAASADLVAAYGATWKRLKTSLDRLTAKMDEAKKNGEPVSVAWLFRAERFLQFMEQLRAESDRFAGYAETRITAAQAAATQAAAEHARALIDAAMGPRPAGIATSFTTFSPAPVINVVGTLRPGSPLRALLDALGPAVSKKVRAELVAGVALGKSPREIAKRIRLAFGANLNRALTIARTETLRSYREGNRQTFLANRNVVKGWTWQAALDSRTCAFCWAMNGTEHPLNAPMATHPNCRCAEVPLTTSWRDLGFDVPEPRPAIARGSDLFDQLSAKEQRAILGPAKYRAYAAGALSLDDIPGFKRSAQWGRVGFERSLIDILGDRAKPFYLAA